MSHFVHRSQDAEECIAAIATPPGEGGIAIVRLSGQDALQIANRVFSGDVTSYLTHTVHFGRVKAADERVLDEVLLLVMHGPRSFTGQDTVEIHCHGGSLLTRRILERCIEAGARPAEPGEFSLRAFLNGKLDLAQAEAIQEVIGAKSERALDAAESRLQGQLSEKIKNFQSRLTESAAILEAWVDFPEEGLEFASMEELCGSLSTILAELDVLVASFHDGRLIQEGITVCLAGKPNVGKSSLLNALLDAERAIVTEHAGTTRDLVEDQLRLNGLQLRLLDTAGIRECPDPIEAEGIKRSKQAMGSADLVLWVLDASQEEEPELPSSDPQRTLVVWNKVDLPHRPLPHLDLPHVVEVSALERDGLDALRTAIDEVIWAGAVPDQDQLLITSVRHRDALQRASAALRAVIDGLRAGVSAEFVSFEMRCVLVELGSIIGVDIGEQLLSSIFSKFCLGK